MWAPPRRRRALGELRLTDEGVLVLTVTRLDGTRRLGCPFWLGAIAR